MHTHHARTCTHTHTHTHTHRHKSSKGQFKLSTGRNYELTSLEGRGNVEPTAAHRHLEQPVDDLDKMNSEKAKEALSAEEEVVPQPPAPTSAEGECKHSVLILFVGYVNKCVCLS